LAFDWVEINAAAYETKIGWVCGDKKLILMLLEAGSGSMSKDEWR